MARRAKHRENIVSAAMRLFRRQGYAATGLLQIVADSGAPKGSLYHYFPAGKEALAVEAVRFAGARVADMLEGQYQKTRSVNGFLVGVAETYAQWMKEGGFASGCPIATTMLECAPAAPEITEAGRDAFRRWVDIAANAYERDGIARKIARRNAEAFIAAIEGALILARVQKNAAPLRHVAKAFSAAP